MSWYWALPLAGLGIGLGMGWMIIAWIEPRISYGFMLNRRWLLWTEGRVFTRWEVRGNDLHKGWSIVWVSGRTLGRRRAMTKAQEWAIRLELARHRAGGIPS